MSSMPQILKSQHFTTYKGNKIMALANQALNATPTTGYTFTPVASTNVGTDFAFPSNAGLSVSNNGDVGSSPLYPYHSLQHAQSLIATAHALVSPRGRGIYATDETPEGIDERLAAAEELEKKEKGKDWTDDERKERRKGWRECLYDSVPAGVSCSCHLTV